MDAQRFLAEFGHIVSAQGGIQQLRQMILTLAVSGDLLVPDEPQDATPLLESINFKKTTHPEQKKVVPAQTRLDRTDIRVPSHWAVCRLGDLVLTITGGGTPSKGNPAYWKGAIPWASVKDLKNNKYLTETEDLISEEGVINSSTNLIPAGRVIVCTRMGLGKVVINKIPVAINQDLKAFELPEEVNIDYFYILYRTRNIKGKGTTVSGIKQDQLLALPSALPPIEEQARIVAKVDELMALCDKLETQQQDREKLSEITSISIFDALSNAQSPIEIQTAWNRLNAEANLLLNSESAIQALRKTILDLAVAGRLSYKEPDDGNAIDLIEQIQTCKKQLIASGQINHRKPVAAETLQETVLPSHWTCLTLDEAISHIDAGWSPACLAHPRRDENTWAILKTTAVQTLQFLPNEHKELPNSLQPRPHYEVNDGDILITRAGPKNRVAICCVVDKTPARLMISDKIIRFHIVNDLIDARYIALCLSAGESGRILERQKSGMADSQMNISQDKLRAIPIPLPPRAEQERILIKVETLMTICNQLSEQLKLKQQLHSRFAVSSIAAITGIRTEEEEALKSPKTELIAKLRLANNPDIKEQAPLAAILARHQSEMSAGDLWQRYGGEIDAFYAQLNQEVGKGWIAEPTIAEMRETEAG
ncbi:MAG: restriction endonuclease subunit S [Methylovulum sp.]|nr:restriction endonuclease subunit S [Methylovulum sp.]